MATGALRVLLMGEESLVRGEHLAGKSRDGGNVGRRGRWWMLWSGTC
jgi:hypothetical protein